MTFSPPMNRITRRSILGGATALASALSLPVRAAPEGITHQLAGYMAAARERPLPPEVVVACKDRILDTLGAMISGSRMQPGIMAHRYVQSLRAAGGATIVGAQWQTNAVDAALCNAMCAHADETDDFEPVTKAHPGCSAVPAALAMAETHARSGTEMIRAVALGYDLCCRLLFALGPDLVRSTHRSAEGTSSTFSALGAAASLARLDEQGMRFALSYAAQQVSGLWSWVEDNDHVEKAFDFAGMGARNGVTAAGMVEAGFTGVGDVLDGTHNLLIALSTAPRPAAMVQGLGQRFFVTETAIKTFSVGYPIQSPLDAMLVLRKQYGLTPDNVRLIKVRVPADAIGIVGRSAMPDVNCQHLVALALVKGEVSFSDSHDRMLMNDPAIRKVQAKVEVVGDPALVDPAAPRGGAVSVTLEDGSTVEHLTKYPPGTKENPLTTERVNLKVRDLIAPVLGGPRAEQLIAQINALERVSDVRSLRSLLVA